MLSELDRHIAALLALTRRATLATRGPAGLQVSTHPCVSSGIHLYLLLPCTSDHLLNLETEPLVAVTSERWSMQGKASLTQQTEALATLLFADAPDAPWSVVVDIQPRRVELLRQVGWGTAETFDLD